MFKKFILALTLATSLFATAPKAHAGVGIGLIFGAPGAGAAIGACVGASVVIGTAISENDELTTIILVLIGLPVYAAGGALLDVDSSLTHDQLFKVFQEKYPFIDNHEALASLSVAVKEKSSAFAEANPEASKAYVTLNREEVASALETADISQAQFEQIAADLM